jgi:sarcosine oxidase subunit gamma
MHDHLLPELDLLHDDTGTALKHLFLGGVKLYALPVLARFVLRSRPDGFRVSAQALGIAPPDPLRVSSNKDRHILWQGPDEWLLLAQVEEIQTIRSLMSDAMADYPHSLVDISHRNHAFLLVGAEVEYLLASACMLDLSLNAFPVGMTTRTLFGKADITLWRKDKITFHVELWRSFAPYVIGLLKQAALTEPSP